jgi:hypothetical protein
MKPEDICIVVQGPTICEDVQNLKDCWKGFTIIFSTWEDANKSCYSDNDIVIYNKYPANRGPQNLNLQRISSLNGFVRADSMGFKRVLKWRSDLKTNNGVELIKLFDENSINCYAFIHHKDGYLNDLFMEGDTDEMINLFSIPSNELAPPYPEFAFTKRLYKLGFNSKINFIYKKLVKDEVDIFWRSRMYWMSNNVSQGGYDDKLPETKNACYN